MPYIRISKLQHLGKKNLMWLLIKCLCLNVVYFMRDFDKWSPKIALKLDDWCAQNLLINLQNSFHMPNTWVPIMVYDILFYQRYCDIPVHVTAMLVTNACNWWTCVLTPHGHSQRFWPVQCGDDDYFRGSESQYPIVENHMLELACHQDAMFVIMCTRYVGKMRGQRMWWLLLD